jgi:hypothetical protein
MSTEDATYNYPGAFKTINCNVPPMEVVRARKAAQVAEEKRIAEHEEYRRVKKGKRTLTHILPTPKSDGYVSEDERPTTTTVRIER